MGVLSLKDLGDSLGFAIEDGLIQNTNYITFEDAKEINQKLILRWRYRICKKTGEPFDILEKGFGYEVN
tara:strand:- start:393 stop:599 length:207 start_codon:yes stop_codon:yes gene_type:complete